MLLLPVSGIPNNINTLIKERVEVSEEGCWVWTGHTVFGGYGSLHVRNPKNKMWRAHRIVAYALTKTLYPVYDHLCRNRKCVNPGHLEPVTIKENNLRGKGVAGRNARKTHCPKGHPYSGDNLYIPLYKQTRMCRECNRIRARESHHRKRADVRAIIEDR